MSQILDRGLDSSSGLAFVQERLALLGKTVFLLSFGFFSSCIASADPRRRRSGSLPCVRAPADVMHFLPPR